APACCSGATPSPVRWRRSPPPAPRHSRMPMPSPVPAAAGVQVTAGPVRVAAAPPSPALGPVTSPGNGARVARRRQRHPLRALITLLVAALLCSGGYAAWHWLRDGPVTITPRCIAGTSGNAAAIGVEQAGNAALIGAIGIERGLPARAVTIAFDTAVQESMISNLDSGDRGAIWVDNVRSFQGLTRPVERNDP